MPVTVAISASLNGGSGSATVYEDTTGDGNADNQQSVTLGNGYRIHRLDTLTGGTGNDYWVQVSPSTSDPESTPVVDHVRVDSEPTNVQLATQTTLNGGSVDVALFEDETGDGNADNTQTVTVSDGYDVIDLPNLSGGTGNDYWARTVLNPSGPASTPVVQSISAAVVETVEATDAGTITAATGSSLSPTETATLSVSPTLVLGNGAVQSAPEVTEATENPALVDAIATVLSAAETTEATGAALTDAAATPLSADEITEAVESGLVSAVATPLTPTDTATSSETPGVQTAGATVLSTDESPVTTDSGSVTAAAATVQTTTTLVEDFIAGTVTLSGSGVQGAKVYVINAENDSVEGTATTDANGDYGVTVPADPPYHIAVQYDDGSQKYNALSKPFVE